MAKHNPLDDLPRIHPRYHLRKKAELELRQFLIDWVDKHPLTVAEELWIIADVMAGRARGYATHEDGK